MTFYADSGLSIINAPAGTEFELEGFIHDEDGNEVAVVGDFGWYLARVPIENVAWEIANGEGN